MSGNELLRALSAISSGTLAKLFGTAHYAEIDERFGKWFAWAEQTGERFDTWQDAWHAYNG